MIGWLAVKSKASGLHMMNQLYTSMTASACASFSKFSEQNGNRDEVCYSVLNSIKSLHANETQNRRALCSLHPWGPSLVPYAISCRSYQLSPILHLRESCLLDATAYDGMSTVVEV
jgi:hypothetical protein